ncbi:MAG TPA: hypothetical protein VM662_00990 [Sphingomonas sp.]|nr:hypothetical protein [Sphingomonas sp.]
MPGLKHDANRQRLESCRSHPEADMAHSNEREYLEQRLRTCRQMANNAADPAVSLIHQQFAAEYARRLEHRPKQDR